MRGHRPAWSFEEILGADIDFQTSRRIEDELLAMRRNPPGLFPGLNRCRREPQGLRSGPGTSQFRDDPRRWRQFTRTGLLGQSIHGNGLYGSFVQNATGFPYGCRSN